MTATARQVGGVTAATEHTTVEIGGVVAVTVVAVTATIAMITAVVMIDHTLPPLLPSSSRGRMLCHHVEG